MDVEKTKGPVEDDGDSAGAGEAELAPSDKTAQDYADAMNAVLDIAEIAVSFIPGGTAASKVVKYAPKAFEAARKATSAVPVVTPAARKIADAAGDRASAVSGGMANAVGGMLREAAATVGAMKDGAEGSLREAREARAQKAARRAARKAILDGAGIRMTAETFLDNWRTSEKLDTTGRGSYLDYCGCYVIATYDGSVRKDDFGTFRELFVGKADEMGASIFADMAGRGNVDVYADVKYKQHVYVLLYPCPREKLDQLEVSLITALDAEQSYNGAVS